MELQVFYSISHATGVNNLFAPRSKLCKASFGGAFTIKKFTSLKCKRFHLTYHIIGCIIVYTILFCIKFFIGEIICKELCHRKWTQDIDDVSFIIVIYAKLEIVGEAMVLEVIIK
jgi:hypothetical protein